jgi:hypothetical protein
MFACKHALLLLWPNPLVDQSRPKLISSPPRTGAASASASAALTVCLRPRIQPSLVAHAACVGGLWCAATDTGGKLGFLRLGRGRFLPVNDRLRAN